MKGAVVTTNRNMKIRSLWRWWMVPALLLSGCATHSSDRSDTPDPATKRSVESVIPTPVKHPSFLKPQSVADLPQANDTEVYTIGVSHMPVRDLLFALAQDAKINIDINPGVKGRVTLNVVEQPLSLILERISTQVDIRFENKGDTLVASPDKPHLKSYSVNYLNLTRITSSHFSVGSVGERESHAPIRGDENSLKVDSITRNEFWETLSTNIHKLLGEEPPKPGQRVSQRRNVFAYPMSGLLTVRATNRQHAEVREYLNNVMAGAKRQVRIEATLVEVVLGDTYKTGVNWAQVRNDAGLARGMSNGQSVGNMTATVRGVDETIELLNRFGDVRVLSKPQLLTLNNQMSIMKMVEEEVYFTEPEHVGRSGVSHYAPDARKAPVGLVMNILPQISPDEEVTLVVRPTITRVIGYVESPGGTRIPKVQVRELESIISMQSGQTVMISGLMRDRASDGERRRFLNRLFGSKKSRASKKSELIVFLTPTVVQSNLTYTPPR
ncbi:MAG: hypothetical protein HQL53_02130 [Magnetococcales bacterium]|nr:hypothetical protein [Magnetococcales bacterium]